MRTIRECFWCFKIYEITNKKITHSRFCTREHQQAHWRARNAAKLRKVQADYRKNNVDKVRATKRAWNKRNADYRHLWYRSHAEEVKRAVSIAYRPQMRSRRQAKRIARKMGMQKICTVCRSEERVELHHRDGNPSHNAITNLVYLCKDHHMDEHVKMRQHVH